MPDMSRSGMIVAAEECQPPQVPLVAAPDLEEPLDDAHRGPTPAYSPNSVHPMRAPEQEEQAADDTLPKEALCCDCLASDSESSSSSSSSDDSESLDEDLQSAGFHRAETTVHAEGDCLLFKSVGRAVHLWPKGVKGGQVRVWQAEGARSQAHDEPRHVS